MRSLLRKTEEIIRYYGENAIIVIFLDNENHLVKLISFPGDRLHFPDEEEREVMGIYYKSIYALKMKRYLENLIDKGVYRENLHERDFTVKRDLS